jgi:SRSO17 transposase
VQDKLLHFLKCSVWDDRQVRYFAARHAIEQLSEREEVTTWIIDDTGFLKKGEHSVGVQRQYTGSAGKVTNCQIGVSLCLATDTAQLPVDFALYLPRGWLSDEKRRKKVRIPDDVEFKTKPELALEMIEAARQEGLPGDILLADSAYGDNNRFRATVRSCGFDYAVGINRTTSVFKTDRLGRTHGISLQAQDLARKLPKGTFRRVTWRKGTKGKMSSRFAFVRVKTAHDDGIELRNRELQWLIVEWPDSEDKPSKFFLSTLPSRMSKKEIVRILKERWRTERMYQDLKEELGLDHFEGRSFPGWHHHISVVLTCAAFIVAEQSRAFSPSATGSALAAEDPLAA